jgi:hypothetical protein
MKIWHGYGTEHSMNLVMIGRFRDAATAMTAKDIIDKLTSAARADVDAGRLVVGEPADRYSDESLQVLTELNVHQVGPAELEQFLYEVEVRREEGSIVVTTDESDVQALLKVLLNQGARVEIYSAHDYPDAGEDPGAT